MNIHEIALIVILINQSISQSYRWTKMVINLRGLKFSLVCPGVEFHTLAQNLFLNKSFKKINL